MNVQPFLNQLHSHFRDSIVVDQFEMKVNDRTRRLVKWCFDAVKNAIVVVALKVLADRTNSVFIYTIYIISYFLLLMFCMSYVHGYYYFPLRAPKETRVAFALSSVLSTAAVFLGIMGVSLTSGHLLRAIEVAQTGVAVQKPH